MSLRGGAPCGDTGWTDSPNHQVKSRTKLGPDNEDANGAFVTRAISGSSQWCLANVVAHPS